MIYTKQVAFHLPPEFDSQDIMKQVLVAYPDARVIALDLYQCVDKQGFNLAFTINTEIEENKLVEV